MSNSQRPDGTDARVLTVPDDAPEVWVSRRNSSSKKYHTRECATVEQMNDPKRVAQPIAEWNNHTKCARCERLDTGNDYERPGSGEIRIDTKYHTVTPVRCLAIRAFALRGDKQRDIADVVDIGRGTVAWHITGRCSCDHHGHTVAYDDAGANAHPAGDNGLPTDVRDGGVCVPATTCARIRRLLADTDLSPQPIADVFGASPTTVRKHAGNLDKCPHDHADTHPPVEYDHDAQTWRRCHD